MNRLPDKIRLLAKLKGVKLCCENCKYANSPSDISGKYCIKYREWYDISESKRVDDPEISAFICEDWE